MMAMEVSQQQISDLRKSFFQEIDSRGDTGFHEADLERARTDDNWLRRFLLHHDLNEKEALKMMVDTMQWRKDFQTNDINESTVKMDYVIEGGFFPHGKDKDGCTLFVFKCKKHVKGERDFHELQRCVVYWFERIERQDKGRPITLFFDMDGCGLSNMDMEFTKYLIGLFKQYYPYFLNYILIFEMPWVLSAAFKIIKSWLPEKAVQKIKFVKKSDLKEFVPPEQALKCWGGLNDYTFSFVPENIDSSRTVNNASTSNKKNHPEMAFNKNNPQRASKKVHFADGSSMLDTTGTGAEKDYDGGVLSVHPPGVITFVKENGELVSTLELQNTDSSAIVSYKMKTTSPEKFRVRPSAGCLAPGARATISVTLQPGFQIGGLSRDKFLIMSMPVDTIDISPQELTEMWKNTSNKNVSQHRLRCAQANEVTKNGTAVSVGGPTNENDHNLNQLSNTLTKLSDCQIKLHDSIKRTQLLQWFSIALSILLAIMLVYLMRTQMNDTAPQHCYKHP